MRYRLDGWHSDYAFPFAPVAEDEEGQIEVDAEVESRGDPWLPIAAGAPPFPVVRFVDGVQNSDAVIWIDDVPRRGTEEPAGGQAAPDEGGSSLGYLEDSEPVPGLVASWGAGVMRCSGDGAVVEQLEVQRGVFADARDLGPIHAANLTWRPYVAEEEPELIDRLRGARRRLERLVGASALEASRPDELLVLDGLLHTVNASLASVGMAKRAYRRWLEPQYHRLLGQLRAGERTPLFRIAGDRLRYSFYLCLADPLPPLVAAPASGVARLEFAPPTDATLDELAAFADRVAATLPAFASEPHKDPRAPQNLYPIRGLEQELRRHLGRPGIIRPLLAGQAAVSARRAS